MWDNRPVLNSSWRGDYGPATPPVEVTDDGTGCDPEGAQKGREGFMHVWRSRNGVAPSPTATDDRDGYYYLYDGTWHEQDQIRLAQRPIVPGAWSTLEAAPVEVSNWPIDRGLLTWAQETQAVEQGWSLGSWREGRLQTWRFSVVADVGLGANRGTASAPQLVTTPAGHLLAVYEDGPSDNPNLPGANPIWLRTSQDGGQTWAHASRIGQGYMPDVAVTESSEVGVIYFEASEPSSTFAKIKVARSFDLTTWATATLNIAPPERVHWQTHSNDAEGLIGVPSLAATGELFVAAWVRGRESEEDKNRIVTSRASRLTDPSHYEVSHEDNLTVGQQTRLTVTAVNTYDMRVNLNDAVDIATTGGSGANTPQPLGFEKQSVRLINGHASVYTTIHSPQVQFSVGGHLGGGLEKATVALRAYADDAGGNYRKARDVRNALIRTTVGRDGRLWTYQVEYVPGESTSQSLAQTEGYENDTQYLARFERVWAYTQGIALAQLSKKSDPQSMAWAQGMARFLCDHAKPGTLNGEDIILGWPFSWNTVDDTWKDVRLVTGANAWAIHGLGVFVASVAFQALEAGEGGSIRGCYQMALKGLEQHRRAVIAPETGATVSLMTAGWTTLGLEHAEYPASLLRTRAEDSGEGPRDEDDPKVQWSYYSVLDALGYEHFDEERPPIIQRFRVQDDGRRTMLDPLVLNQADLERLKEVVPANNVVTEHNLDVLSVLNHAIDHAQTAGIADVEHLLTWRNQLRDGIFFALWDSQGWKNDLRDTLLDLGVDEERQARIHAALEEDQLGRVVTGGQLTGARAPHGFEPSTHVAIDNCSWLSLSVDYEDLALDSVYIQRLAQCLTFTELHFAKLLSFQGNAYYGAHYFQNAFRDPYIDPSSLQESSFHLEATAGLILGLQCSTSIT